MKHQVMYKGSNKFVLLYNVPEPPPIMASIYADISAMNLFNDTMKFIEKHSLEITNPEFLIGQFELIEDEPFDLPAGVNVFVTSQYKCELRHMVNFSLVNNVK